MINPICEAHVILMNPGSVIMTPACYLRHKPDS